VIPALVRGLKNALPGHARAGARGVQAGDGIWLQVIGEGPAASWRAFRPWLLPVFCKLSPSAFKHMVFRKTVFRQRGSALRLALHLIFIAGFVFTAPSLAQKLVDPNSVAPEFRDAAEKRRAEQIKVVECNRKANEAKVLPRDRIAYLNHCLEAAGEK